MQRQILKVIVIDDDGLSVRKSVFEQFFALEAERAAQRLELIIHTHMPRLDLLGDANIISWDNDLGYSHDLGCNVETVRTLRQLQFTDDTILYPLRNKIHLVHSMNTVASDNLHSLLSQDLGLKTFVVPFNYMKQQVETRVFKLVEPLCMWSR